MTFGAQSPEFVRLNAYRVHVGMPPLPSYEDLNNTLFAAGLTHCCGVRYPIPTMVPKK